MGDFKMKIKVTTFNASFPIAYEKTKDGKLAMVSEKQDFKCPQMFCDDGDYGINHQVLLKLFKVVDDVDNDIPAHRVLFNLLNKLAADTFKTAVYTAKNAAVKPKDMTKPKLAMVRQMMQAAKLKKKPISEEKAWEKVEEFFSENM
jgi:hypothetical protein